MTATIEQVQEDCLTLIALAQRGEDVVITSQGQAIGRLTGIAVRPASPNRQAWLEKLASLRKRTTTGRVTPTSETILDDLRAERG